MSTRITVSLSIGILASLLASCGEPQTTPPGMRYENHVNAGGVAPPSLPPPPRSGGVTNDPKAGEGLFASMNCDGCHGGGATGWVAPSLVDGRWRYGGADQEIFQSIFYGRPKGMPSYGGLLGVDGVWAIVGYVKSQPVPAVVPTTNYEELATSAPAPSTNSTPASGEPTEGLAEIARYGCTACHAIDAKIVGPAYRDVAAKYRGQAGVQQRLEAKVRSGGSGVWGDIPMPPNAQVPEEDIHRIVEWILTSPMD